MQNILRNIKELHKVRQNRRALISHFAYFLKASTRYLFLQGRLNIRLRPSVWDLPSISMCATFLSLTLKNSKIFWSGLSESFSFAAYVFNNDSNFWTGRFFESVLKSFFDQNLASQMMLTIISSLRIFRNSKFLLQRVQKDLKVMKNVKSLYFRKFGRVII